MRSIGKLMIVTAMVVTVIVTGTATGHADAKSAYNEKAQWLTSNPTDGMANGVVTRRIYVGAGTYVWLARQMSDCKRTTHLGAGWYTWTDTLDPRGGYYRHTSTLDPDNPAWAPTSRVCAWWPSESGTWVWGSALDPQF